MSVILAVFAKGEVVSWWGMGRRSVFGGVRSHLPVGDMQCLNWRQWWRVAAGGWAGRETFLVVALYIEETIHHWRPVLNLRLLPCRRRIGVCVQSTPPQHWLPVAC